jgi:hypothetical protein
MKGARNVLTCIAKRAMQNLGEFARNTQNSKGWKHLSCIHKNIINMVRQQSQWRLRQCQSGPEKPNLADHRKHAHFFWREVTQH